MSLVSNQAQSQQQQQKHYEPQQWFVVPMGGLTSSLAGGAMGGQPLPEAQDVDRLAANTVGVTAIAKQAAEFWRAKEEVTFFIARSGFNMSEEISRQLLLLVRDVVADGPEAITKWLITLSELTVEEFPPPLPVGVRLVTIPAEINFATFVAAFMATLSIGMERAQAVCKKRMCVLQREVDELQEIVEVYLQRNMSSHLAQPAKVVRCSFQP